MAIKIGTSEVIGDDKVLRNLGDGSAELTLSGNTLSITIGGTLQDSVDLSSVTTYSSSGNFTVGGDLTVMDELKFPKYFKYYAKEASGSSPSLDLGEWDLCTCAGITVQERGDGSEWWRCRVVPADGSSCSDPSDGTILTFDHTEKARWCMYYGTQDSIGADEDVWCRATCLNFT